MTISEASKPNVDVIVPDSSVVAVPVESPHNISYSCIKGNLFNVTLCGDFKLCTTSIGKRNTFITLCGDHTLDLRRVQFPDSTGISVVFIKLCGNIRLIVPANVSVSTCAIMLCGDRRIETAAASDSLSIPHVQLTIVQLCGDVVVANTDDRDP